MKREIIHEEKRTQPDIYFTSFSLPLSESPLKKYIYKYLCVLPAFYYYYRGYIFITSFYLRLWQILGNLFVSTPYNTPHRK